MDRAEKAVEYRKKGYNCAQTVICTYSDKIGLTVEQAAKISEGFGGGMGGMQDTCGAVTAMFMVIGMLKSSGRPKESKREVYSLIREYAGKFKEKNGSVSCKVLKESENCSCMQAISDAVELLKEF